MAQINSAFVPTTNVWDVHNIQSINVNSPEFKELLVRLYQNINNISLALNMKDTGYYDTQQFINGQVYFPNPTPQAGTTQTFRQVIRKVVNFGALPNTGSKSVAHGISCTDLTTFTRIYGTASDTTGHNYISLDYAGTNPISINVNGTNVTVTTTSNRSNFNITYIVLEYLQQ